MRYFLAPVLCVMLAGCHAYDYEKKMNVIEDRPDELVVVPPLGCPNWEEPAEGDAQNNYHSNYGCANVTNMGVMVTNPRDMIKGRGSEADAARTATYVRAYNAGAPSNPDGGGSGASSGGTSTGAEAE